MADGKSSLIKIKVVATVKLDGSNLFSWKAHTTAHLRGYYLLNYIESPVDKKDALVVQQDQLLLGWLLSSMSPAVLPQVEAFTSSIEVWTALQGIYNIFYARKRKGIPEK